MSNLIKLAEEVAIERTANETNTELKKSKFIQKIRGDLGVEIKKNPRKVRVIKLSPLKRLGNFITKLFTSF